jgi:integrase
MTARHSTGHTLLLKRDRGDQWYVKLRTPDGRQVKRRLGPAWAKRGRCPDGFYTEALAAAELQRMLDAADRGGYDDHAAPVAHTFGAACDEWLRYGEHERRWSERNLATNTGAIKARLIPYFGKDTPVGEITTARVDAYRGAALSGHENIGRGNPLAPNTVARDMTNLSAIFRRAVRLGRIASSPYEDCERVHIEDDEDEIVFLAVEEVYAVARAADTEQEAALYIVAAFTGLRFGELRTLRWRDVDFVNAAVRVERSLPVHGTREKAPKSRKGRRSPPLLDQAACELDRLSKRDELTRDGDLVFRGRTGGYLDYETTKDAFYAALYRAGLGHHREREPAITFHKLRHTYGTRMAAAGVPMRTLQAWMGHANISTTERYSHYSPQKDDAARLSAFIASQMGTEMGTEPPTSTPTGRNSAQLGAA